MNNENYYKKKYFVYKMKYLQTKLMQRGGANEITLNLPKDIKKIKTDNAPISPNSANFIIKSIETKAECDPGSRLENLLNNTLKDKSAHIGFETKNDIYLYFDHLQEMILKFKNYDDKDENINLSELLNHKCLKNIVIEIKSEDVNDQIQQGALNDQTQQQGALKDSEQQEQDVLKDGEQQEQDVLKDGEKESGKDENNKSIQEQISSLKEQIDKLNTEFENHYHDVPTTGIRQYSKEHPFLKKS